MVYFDWAATAPPDPSAHREVQETAFEYFANPSSIHSPGEKAGKKLAKCREDFARLIGCSAEEIVFTSGGSESNNLVLTSVLNRTKSHSSRHRPNIVISGLEHSSVHRPAINLTQWGIEVRVVSTDAAGTLDLGILADALDDQTRLVSVMTVCNETGAIQPVKRLGNLVKAHAEKIGRPVLFHTDAVQALGKIPFEPVTCSVDTASFSAHKLGGPRGAGALYVRRNSRIDPLYKGGTQEGNLRPGTENLPGIAGFVSAAGTWLTDLPPEAEGVRQRMAHLVEETIALGGKVIPSHREETEKQDYSPYILKLAFPPIPGEVMVRVLDGKGICLSTGSACISRLKTRHRVLKAMGVPDATAASAVRISQGPSTTDDDVEKLVEALRETVPALRKTAG